MIKIIRTHQIPALLEENGTKFLSVRFAKKSGEYVTRNFHPRSRVGLSLNPSRSTLQALETRSRNNPDLVNMRAPGKGWRSFDIKRVSKIMAMGNTYIVY